MTQALLNNLNIQIDDKFGLNDKFAKDDIADFSKVLNIKTESSTQNDTKDANEDSINENADDQLKLADIKNDNKPEIETLKNAIEESIKTSEAFKAIDLTLVQEEIENTEELTALETEENTENQKDETIPTIPDDTITEEDPAMKNDEMLLNQPLENPATAMMLQSQLQKHSFKDRDENFGSDENENDDTNLKSNQISKTLKNYDSIQKAEKDVVMNTMAEKENVIKSEGKRIRDVVEDEVVKELNIETIETECAGAETGSDNLMNNQSPQEQAVKAMMRIEGNSKIEIVSNAQNNKATQEFNTNRILEQITKQIEGLYNGSKVNIVMNPESLGRVSLQLLNLKEGLAAQFTVSTQDAQNIIMKGLAGLKESLLAHGINVDSVTVKLQEAADNEYQSDWTEQEGSNSGNKQQSARHQKENEKQFEQTMFEIEENGKV